jgi:flagellar export protein FliJ
MSQRDGFPQYTLKGLLTMRRGDLDLSRVETTKARDVLDQAAEDARRIGLTISEIEEELRAVCETGATIDPGRHAALSGFLKDRRQAMLKQMTELRNAEQLYEQSRNRLHRVKQGVMVLEKHKETKQQESEIEASRREQKLMDDMWLLHPSKK